jgi:uncharacterized protein
MSAVTVKDNPEQARYEIDLDGELAGFAEYARQDGRITFTHTEVGQAYAGRGLARDLVRFALEDARAQELEVVPLCAYVRKVIADDPERYAGLVPEAERPRFGL